MGISGLLDVAKTALFTAQQALTVTGHNIGNVNTPGFSRQEVILTEQRPADGSPGQVGTGVKIAENSTSGGYVPEPGVSPIS